MNTEDVAADFTSESMNFASGGVVNEGWDPAVDDVSKLDTRFNPPIVRNVQFTMVHLTEQELRKIVREELEAVLAGNQLTMNYNFTVPSANPADVESLIRTHLNKSLEALSVAAKNARDKANIRTPQVGKVSKEAQEDLKQFGGMVFSEPELRDSFHNNDEDDIPF